MVQGTPLVFFNIFFNAATRKEPKYPVERGRERKREVRKGRKRNDFENSRITLSCTVPNWLHGHKRITIIIVILMSNLLQPIEWWRMMKSKVTSHFLHTISVCASSTCACLTDRSINGIYAEHFRVSFVDREWHWHHMSDEDTWM